jgi:TRAP-type C4-dicarboxylate transport system substrate-binding protein|tara:strand:- start:3246 stop:4238 length:993 start_codon:yes stop_codon:yes gene_type:complete
MKIFNKLILSLVTLSFITTSSFAVTWKASHQWPGGKGDPRDEMVQIIAKEVAKANVDFKIQVYPGKSLYKPKEQWKPLTTGDLDMTAFPLDYANKFHPEFSITLMPGIVKNHDHSKRINKSAFMKSIRKIMDDAGVMVVSDAWLGGAFASKKTCITNPASAKGQVMRAAGPMFNKMLEGAGSSIASMPSSEIYTGLQTGVLTGANTSSGSFVSYKLYEQIKCLTPPGKYGLWFMYEPILMSKKSYNALNSKQKSALNKAGKKAEEWMLGQVANLDKKMEDKFKAAGVKLSYMTESDYKAWLAIAKETSFKDFSAKVPAGAKLLKQALAVK